MVHIFSLNYSLSAPVCLMGQKYKMPLLKPWGKVPPGISVIDISGCLYSRCLRVRSHWKPVHKKSQNQDLWETVIKPANKKGRAQRETKN